QSSATAGTLNGCHAPRLERWMPGAEHETFHGLVEGRITRDRHVGFRTLLGDELLLGLTYRVQHGRRAGLVLVNPHAEVYFARIRVLPEQGHDADDRIGCDRLEGL